MLKGFRSPMKSFADPVVVQSVASPTIAVKRRGIPHRTVRSDARHGDVVLARPWFLPSMDIALATFGFASAFLARYLLRFGGIHQVIAPVQPSTVIRLGAIGVGLTIIGLARSGTYRRNLGLSGTDTVLAIGRVTTLAMAAVIISSAATQELDISRLVYLYAWVAIIILLAAGRALHAAVLASAYRNGVGTRRVIVIGATSTGMMVMQNVAARLSRGYKLLGFVGENHLSPQRFGRFARLGTVAEIDRVLVEHQVDECIVALPSASHAHVADIFQHCERAGVAVKLVPDLFDLRLSRVSVDEVAGIPLIDVRSEYSGTSHRLVKRVVDVIGSTAALVLAAPIMAAIAIAIRLESPGPILFRQERLGRDRKPFTIFKFRSMRVDAERQLALFLEQNEASGPIFKMRRDPRVTRVGRVLRMLSLDELPQLYNVARGEMSLVGPRPPLAHEVERYEDWHRRRLEVIPGITCLWGVSGRSKLDFDEMAMLDIYYIDNWSLGLDLRILMRTAFALMRPSGAY